ncbi:hypothetical protein GE21DRAFT_1395 [Neurospora crassa]|uniref:All development altered-4 n=1 Tax=Neurospora crassa (strain ATCC 24698 / 74-OR23-1A / CBS 708.71 / DSM 1257 / FGSC 987) TaxID=367110 RepID=Q7SEM4_NEUCR|nr:all development altered-4 [Neurospora crassa OR74A]EAA35261.1 all development altered-4 [Neurospora crassa OR74A]KHE81043.1 hypothetical protein GE21DRAFT_1395 [Neurospora crassa]|eukprot:XP_964497.1 all development altered-4 [Neurospora crassa OR74A]
MISNSEVTKEKEPVKRRACDECRTRKLACTKEQDGCARCKREGVHCNYSAQKPMGRPRKRPYVDVAEASRKEAKTDDVPPSETAALTYPVSMPFDGTLNLDLDMCFLDVTNTDINFSDIFDPNFQFGSYGFPLSLDYDIPQPGPAPGQIEAMPKEETGHANQAWMDSTAAVNAQWQPVLGGYLDVNFDGIDVQTSTSACSSSIQQYSSPFPKREQLEGIYPNTSQNHHGSRPPSRSEVSESTVPHLTPGGSSTTSPSDSTNTNDRAVGGQPPAQCACSDNLREAMESLRIVPTDNITQALYTVRTVTKTAHETILCSICGDPPLGGSSSSASNTDTDTDTDTDTKTDNKSNNNNSDENEPPDSAIQNMVLLAAILPSLSSSYTLLLDLVEKETQSATSSGRHIFFDLEGYGGLWGPIATSWKRCEDMVALLAQPLPPATWRLIARAMLKLDVYGQGGAAGTASQRPVISLGDDDGGCMIGSRDKSKGNGLQEEPCEKVEHIGLKDIFARLEERSRRRQERLEALVASGELEGVIPPISGGLDVGNARERSTSPIASTGITTTLAAAGEADEKMEGKVDGEKTRSPGMRIIASAKSAMDRLLIS